MAALRLGCDEAPTPADAPADGLITADLPVAPDVAAEDAPAAPDLPPPPDASTEDVTAAPDTPPAPDVPTRDAADAVDAGPPDVGPRCDAAVACDGGCVDTSSDRAHCGACGRACAVDQECVGGACVPPCAAGELRCGAACVDPQTSSAHCGRCGASCGSGDECVAGACLPRCASGETRCDGRCVDLRAEPAHCGVCGLRCRGPGVAAAACASRRCAVGRCEADRADCNGEAADGCEIDTRVDLSHCGACGSACVAARATSRCEAGRCAIARCDAGWGDCDGDYRNGCEVSLASDRARCGACDVACGAGLACSLGACSATCAAGLTNCGGQCVATNRDPGHCGACGRACALSNVAQHACVGGVCAPALCRPGFGDCDLVGSNGCETALGASLDHCGACGQACRVANGVGRCEAGQCRVGSCATGFADCDGLPENGCEVDTRNDRAHCGGCDTVTTPRACHPDDRCAFGRCATTCAAGIADCGGRCVEVASSAEHCGACGRTCALSNATSLCAAGRCGVARCADGRGDCDRAAANGCEADLRADPSHCGACGRGCAFANGVARCADGRCALAACDAGFADCDGDPANGCEANLRADPDQCGGCGASRSCGSGELCAAGRCVLRCDGETTSCAGRCVDLRADPSHCGACGRACGGSAGALPGVAAYRCADGLCAARTCAAGFGDCDGLRGNGCEANLRASLTHCGACGRRCAPPNAVGVCAAGACDVSSCAAGFGDCDARADNGCEVDTRSDPAHCGGCGRRCGAGLRCVAGVCAGACGAGSSDCDGRCRAVDLDPDHCGACGARCPSAPNANPRCAGGFCGVVCAEGYGNCDGRASNGCERALGTVDDCARCGDRCALPNAVAGCSPSRTCVVASCAPSWADCDGDPSNGCEANLADDSARCGGCTGRACATGERCAGGRCVATCADGNARCADGPRLWCADLGRDANNCGGCGIACVARPFAAPACEGGVCALRCQSGRGDCDGDPDDGCETDLRSDDARCGACDRACPEGARCVEGACRWPGGYRAVTPAMSALPLGACALAGARRVRLPSEDASVTTIPLPFELRFWGQRLAAGSALTLAANGYARPGTGHPALVGGVVPGGVSRGGVLAGHWADLRLRGAEVCVASVGVEGARTLVISWPDLGYFDAVPGSRVEMELLVEERSGVVEFRFGRVEGGRFGTAGLEHPDGLRAVRPEGCADTTGWNCRPEPGAVYRFEPAD